MVGQLPADKDCNPLRYVLDMNMGQWCAEQRTCFVQNTQLAQEELPLHIQYLFMRCSKMTPLEIEEILTKRLKIPATSKPNENLEERLNICSLPQKDFIEKCWY